MAIMYKDGNTMRKIAKVMYLDPVSNTIKTMTSCKGLVDGVIREFLPQQNTPKGAWEIRDAQNVGGYCCVMDGGLLYYESGSATFTYDYLTDTSTRIFNGCCATNYASECKFYNNSYYRTENKILYAETKKVVETLYYEKPTGTAWSGMSILNNNAYCFGGHVMSSSSDITAELTPTTDIVNLTTKAWTTGASMPQARAYLRTAIYNNDIYAFGGGYNTVLKYNVSGDVWSEISSLPNNATTCRYCWIYMDKIYTLIGTDIYMYNPVNNSWSGIIATIPVSLTSEDITPKTFIAHENNKLFIFGMQDRVSKAYKLAILTV